MIEHDKGGGTSSAVGVVAERRSRVYLASLSQQRISSDRVGMIFVDTPIPEVRATSDKSEIAPGKLCWAKLSRCGLLDVLGGSWVADLTSRRSAAAIVQPRSHGTVCAGTRGGRHWS